MWGDSPPAPNKNEPPIIEHTTMSHSLTRGLAVLCITFTMIGTLNARQPRMEKALLFLEEAQSSPNPIPLLESAQLRLQNATGNKAGYRVKALRVIKSAIAIIRRGGDAQSQIDRAIVLVQLGIDNATPANP